MTNMETKNGGNNVKGRIRSKYPRNFTDKIPGLANSSFIDNFIAMFAPNKSSFIQSGNRQTLFLSYPRKHETDDNY